MNLQLSERILNMSTSATLAMAAKARELKSEGKDIIGLSLGEPDFNTPCVDHKSTRFSYYWRVIINKGRTCKPVRDFKTSISSKVPFVEACSSKYNIKLSFMKI